MLPKCSIRWAHFWFAYILARGLADSLARGLDHELANNLASDPAGRFVCCLTLGFSDSLARGFAHGLANGLACDFDRGLTRGSLTVLLAMRKTFNAV